MDHPNKVHNKGFEFAALPIFFSTQYLMELDESASAEQTWFRWVLQGVQALECSASLTELNRSWMRWAGWLCFHPGRTQLRCELFRKHRRMYIVYRAIDVSFALACVFQTSGDLDFLLSSDGRTSFHANASSHLLHEQFFSNHKREQKSKPIK